MHAHTLGAWYTSAAYIIAWMEMGRGHKAKVRYRSRNSVKHTGFAHIKGRFWMCICAHGEKCFGWVDNAMKLAGNWNLLEAIKWSWHLWRMRGFENCLYCWGPSQFLLWFKFVTTFGTSLQRKVGLCGCLAPLPSPKPVGHSSFFREGFVGYFDWCHLASFSLTATPAVTEGNT